MSGRPLLFALALAAGCAAAWPMPCRAAEPAGASDRAVDPATLERAISRVIRSPEYSWRLPRQPELAQAAKKHGFFDEVMEWLAAIAEDLRAWLQKLFARLGRLVRARDRHEPLPSNWWETPQMLLFILLAGTACLAAILLLRTWRRRRARAAVRTAQPVARGVDLRADDISPAELPSDRWLGMARELLLAGDLRLALRAALLACLATLGQHERLTIARHKSNRDYVRELQRRSHDRPAVLEAFRETVLFFEQTWYGVHPPTSDMVERCIRNQQRIGAP